MIGALIGAGASLLGNLIGAKSQKSANDANRDINQMNNEFNERMMQKQMDYNTMMWNKQNDYNSPLAQRQRLEAAGMNPYMMMNGGSAGNAQSAGSTSMASAAGAAPQQAFQPNLQGIPEAILMAKQGKNIDADTHSKVIDNQTRGIRNLQAFANQVAEGQSRKLHNKLQETINNYADAMQMEQLRNLKTQNENLIREGLLMDKNLSIFDEQTRLDFAQRAASILLTNAQTRATKQQTIHEIQSMYETVARTNGIKISYDIAKRSAQAIVDKAYNDEYWSRTSPSWYQTVYDWVNRKR